MQKYIHFKKHYFRDVTKVQNFDEKRTIGHRKRTKKFHLNIFACADKIGHERVKMKIYLTPNLTRLYYIK
jgi:hypothetical protein